MKSKTSQDAKMIYNDKTRHFQSELTYLYLILKKKGGGGSPRILEWVAYPFSSRSSWPRNQTRVSLPTELSEKSQLKKKKERKLPTTSYSSPWDRQLWYRLNSIFVSFNTDNHRARRSPNTIPTFIISQKLQQRFMSNKIEERLMTQH